jgi:biopolymer transport protein ExbD
MVSGEEVSISGNVVGRVQDLVKEEYLNIPALEEKLRDMKKQFEDLHAMAEGNTNAFKGDVNIQAHKEVEFAIIKRVMFSCASAGYNNINFATLQKGEAGAPGESTAAATP